MDEDISELLTRWGTDQDCVGRVMNHKYPGLAGICPRCGKWSNFSPTARRAIYSTTCGRVVTALADTPFFYSRIPLPIWFFAIYMHSTYPGWMGMGRLCRMTGLGESGAQRMLKTIRSAPDPGQWIR